MPAASLAVCPSPCNLPRAAPTEACLPPSHSHTPPVLATHLATLLPCSCRDSDRFPEVRRWRAELAAAEAALAGLLPTLRLTLQVSSLQYISLHKASRAVAGCGLLLHCSWAVLFSFSAVLAHLYRARTFLSASWPASVSTHPQITNQPTAPTTASGGRVPVGGAT